MGVSGGGYFGEDRDFLLSINMKYEMRGGVCSLAVRSEGAPSGKVKQDEIP